MKSPSEQPELTIQIGSPLLFWGATKHGKYKQRLVQDSKVVLAKDVGFNIIRSIQRMDMQFNWFLIKPKKHSLGM